MTNQNVSIHSIIETLHRKNKELYCLYLVEELFLKSNLNPEEIYSGIVQTIPLGMQFPEVCKAKLVINESVYQVSDFAETPWELSENLFILNELVGKIGAFYIEERPLADKGPFLKEECMLINKIAGCLQCYLLHEKLKTEFLGN